jgi:hypothetical protein
MGGIPEHAVDEWMAAVRAIEGFVGDDNPCHPRNGGITGHVFQPGGLLPDACPECNEPLDEYGPDWCESHMDNARARRPLGAGTLPRMAVGIASTPSSAATPESYLRPTVKEKPTPPPKDSTFGPGWPD